MKRWRRLAWGAVAVLALGAAALAVAPSLVAPFLAARLSAATGATVRIGWISWNPLVGRVVLHRVQLASASGGPPVVTVGSIGVDMAVRRWLHGERALDALVLRRPWVSLQRTGPGDFNLATLLPALTTSSGGTTDEASAQVGPPSPFRIRRLRIVSGAIEFRDETTVPVLETSLHLDDASARDLVLAGGGAATLAFHVESRLESEPLTLDVSYESAPDSSHLEATLSAKNASLARALLYVPLGWQRTSGSLDATLTYERRLEKNQLRQHGLRARLTLHDLALAEPWAAEPMLRAMDVQAPALTVDFMKQRTDLGVITVEGFQALVTRDEKGVHVPLATGSTDAAPSTWQTTLDRVVLGRGTALLRRVLPTMDADLTVPVRSGTIRLPRDEVQFSFSGDLAGGRVTLDGATRGASTTMTFALDGLALREMPRLFVFPLPFESGRLTGALQLRIEDAPSLSGTLHTTDVRTAPSPEHPEEVLAWQRLDASLAASSLDPLQLHVEDVAATWPYVMLHRRSNGWFPLTLAGSSAAGDASSEWLRLDRLSVQGGRIEFYDSTLPKAYGIDLTDLTASASSVSLAPFRAEQLRLGGALDELSPLQLSGDVRPPLTTLSLAVDRLLLPPLNPYLAPALGYEVKNGLAKIQSAIRLEGTTLQADADLVLSRFAMRAAGPDAVEATIGTPLSVALALMKDTRGDIHLQLPIHGDVASQQYRVGSLLREALGTALLGTLRAPLGFLRGIFSRDDGERFDLRPVPFPAGRATLDAEGESRVDELARLLGRQTALRAVLIPEPSRADAEALGADPLAALADLSRMRAEAVAQRLTKGNGIDPARVGIERWDPHAPTADDSVVDVQLRID